MRKFRLSLAALLLAVLSPSLLTLSSCNIFQGDLVRDFIDNAAPNVTPPAVTSPESTPEPTPTPASTPTPTPEPTPEPATTPPPEASHHQGSDSLRPGQFMTETGRVMFTPVTQPWTAPHVAVAPGFSNPYPVRFPSPFNADGTLRNDSAQSGMRVHRNTFQMPTAHTYFDIRQFNGFYLGDLTRQVVYLTFDNGYEFENLTIEILDILKDRDVHAAFFVTLPYIRNNPDIVMRMINEGHVVANHSNRHRNSSTLSDEDFVREIVETSAFFREQTGHYMSAFFRPPNGEYSARTISLTNDLGYRTIFWSLAYMDWVTDNQPGREYAFNRVTSTIHNGCIILLHGVSRSNVEALPDIIDWIRDQGFEFLSLYDLEPWQ